jgi:hypothetical protein
MEPAGAARAFAKTDGRRPFTLVAKQRICPDFAAVRACGCQIRLLNRLPVE